MAQLHQTAANALLLLMLLLGTWGLMMSVAKRPLGGSFRSTYVLSIAVFALQAVIGAALLVSGNRPSNLLHLIYGVVPFLALGGALTYGSNLKPQKEALVLGLAALFTYGLSIRAFTTGGAPTPIVPFVALALLLGLLVYFIPSIVAYQREKKNIRAIWLLNTLLGWTLVGWTVALVWALAHERIDLDPGGRRSSAPTPPDASLT